MVRVAPGDTTAFGGGRCCTACRRVVQQGSARATSKLREMAATRKRSTAPRRTTAENAGTRVRARVAARRRRRSPRAHCWLGCGRRARPSSTSASATCSGSRLIALGVFMGFVLYGGWNGGSVGGGLTRSARLVRRRSEGARPDRAGRRRRRAAGAAGMAADAPAADGRDVSGCGCDAGAGGGNARGELGREPRTRANRRGRACSCRPTAGSSARRCIRQRTGSVQSVGVDILVVVLLFVGVTLLTGASPAGVLRGHGRAAVGRGARSSICVQLGHARRSRPAESRRTCGRGLSITPPPAG